MNYEGMTEQQIMEATNRMQLYYKAKELIDSGEVETVEEAIRVAGLSRSMYYRLKAASEKAEQDGHAASFVKGRSSGRPRSIVLTEDEKQELSRSYVSINAQGNQKEPKSSKSLAWQKFALKPGRRPEILEAYNRRAFKYSLPTEINEVLDAIPTQVIRHHRSPKDARLNGMHTPGQLRIKMGSDKRLVGGDRQSWDDASVNFMLWVPWPEGGDPCSDKFGVRVGRFQLLACVDDATDYCPAFSFVVRRQDSYRAQDVTGAMTRTWTDHPMPAEAMVEGGVWQSKRSLDFYRAAGVKMTSAKGQPHKKLVEQYWSKLWSDMDTQEYGGLIGRFRGEMEAANRQLVKCRKGSLDPTEVFPSLGEGIETISQRIEFRNSLKVHSKRYGTWVPKDRYMDDLARHPRPCLEPSMAWLGFPEFHKRKIRSGLVECRVPSPFGFSFSYHFSHEALWDFEGCKVNAYFDPASSPVRAVITLAQDRLGKKEGDILTTDALCMDNVHMLEQCLDGVRMKTDLSGLARSIEMRKKFQDRTVTVYRAFDLKHGTRQVETVRSGRNAITIERGRESTDVPGGRAGYPVADEPLSSTRSASPGSDFKRKDPASRKATPRQEEPARTRTGFLDPLLDL